MADFSPETLKDEIVADSEVLGYKNSATPGDWKYKGDVADLINDPTKGGTIERTRVKPEEVRGAIVHTEFAALTAPQRSYLVDVLLAMSEINAITGSPQRTALMALFGAGTATRIALAALLDRPGSRAEVLWGDGRIVSAGEVGLAFNLLGV